MVRRLVTAIAALMIVVGMASEVTAQALTEGPEPTAVVGCTSGKAPKILALSDSAVRTTATDFPAFDPTPLLQATFTIGGTANVCVAAHFSAMQGAQDTYGRRLWTMYAVEIDGVAMNGHFTLFGGPLSVGHTADQDIDMVAYNFWRVVSPGTHTIRVRWSGYSPNGSGSPGALIAAPVLTVEHK